MIYVWYALGIALVLMGAFFGYCSAKLLLAAKFVQLGASLGFFGIVLAGWGTVVLWRCVRPQASSSSPSSSSSSR